MKYSYKKVELILSKNLTLYLEDEDILKLSISQITRLVSNFFAKSNPSKPIKMNSDFIQFFFNCLDHYGKEASILFSFVNFENLSIDVVNRLLNDYSDVFDFNMINSTLLKTTT